MTELEPIPATEDGRPTKRLPDPNAEAWLGHYSIGAGMNGMIVRTHDGHLLVELEPLASAAFRAVKCGDSGCDHYRFVLLDVLR